jgi:vacuolar-type H+-ATPase subunit I/STV1
MLRRREEETLTAVEAVSIARGEPHSGSVHLRFPLAVYERLKQEAAAEQLPLTHYVYKLVVQRPEHIVRSRKDKARIAALEQEVEQLRNSAQSGSVQLEENNQLREQLRKVIAEKNQFMAQAQNYVNQQQANAQAYQARIHDLEHWESFGKAVVLAAQNSEEIKNTLMSIPLVAAMFGGPKSPPTTT